MDGGIGREVILVDGGKEEEWEGNKEKVRDWEGDGRLRRGDWGKESDQGEAEGGRKRGNCEK